ncbi:hypothetical protein ACFX2I_001861 [Malus domestica]|uniref:BHLH domain-containing protein n=1 Tax=Malus domestica TaxID=3750 RepID=A0A498KJX6_MALDO|nr:hypothetical protein DVH24_022633 [Malus domestica]
MFPLHQSKKLVFQISSNPRHHHDHTISEDRRVPEHGNMGKSRRRKLAVTLDYMMDDDHKSNDHNKKKKMFIHRENERQRRQEMGILHASLRSLLPLEFIKGKRSISDHMNEAVNYIKHLQNRIKRLDAKRAELKKVSDLISSSTSTDDHGGESSYGGSPSCFTVHPCCGGVQIVISTAIGFRSGEEGLRFSISRVLEVLLEQGLCVVSCVSSKIDDRLLHTIQSEVNDLESIDLSALEHKLDEVLPRSK